MKHPRQPGFFDVDKRAQELTAMGDKLVDLRALIEWVFRERLKGLGLMEVLFRRFHEQLAAQGYEARAGQMVDATFVEAPRQRNKREDNAAIKAGKTPDGWGDPARQPMRRQKDMDARWTKKNNQTFFGYKDHVNADQAHKLIRDYVVTDAAVHDSQRLDELLDVHPHAGRQRPVYADSAYRSKAQEQRLAERGIESRICERGTRDHPLTDAQRASNHQKSKIRSRIEHIFGAQAQHGGHYVRTLGIARARVKIGLMNLVYNMERLGQLLRRDGRAVPIGP